MVNVSAVVASIDKNRIVFQTSQGQSLHCDFASGKVPKVGSKGIAVVDEAQRQIRFKGTRGSAYLRLVEVA